ncbi:MAG: FMN-binding protein [Clostridiales bacterium]|nr:FMN-binding protein [Clostridiales bacterium]
MALLMALALIYEFAGLSRPNSFALSDGYYTAEMADFDTHGWKEFVTIYVNSGEIISVEYNAKNPSGFIKSWDMNYMREMNALSGTYPNEYTRLYSAALLKTQNPARVDAITGATNSHASFRLLAQAAIEHSRKGDRNVAYVSGETNET